MTTQAAPIAAALCMRTEDTPFHLSKGNELLPIPHDFFSKPVMLRGRKEAECCEKDPSWKQLLPYAIAMDEDGLVYCYTRGAAGAEDKLHGNISIGLGGHVDVAPGPGESLEEVLKSECKRELMEEAALEPRPLEFYGLICDTTNAVGNVHIGLLTVRRVLNIEKTVMMGEKDIVEKGEFVSLKYLRQEGVFNRLENWSQLAVKFLELEREDGRFTGKA